MRVIAEIPHPQLKITIFSMNNKYVVKFEAGPYEQVFKVTHEDVEGLDSLKVKIDDDLLEKVAEAFRLMHKSNPWKLSS
jgi:hypothetical protein